MKRKIYIILFVILYAIVAFSSFFHSVDFFSLANMAWMGIILAFAFEIGQAVVLFSILTDGRQRKKFIPWLLMGIFTLVQIIGNVYSSYKYIMINSSENLKYFKEPIFVWTSLPDNQTTVIVTYITSAILPLCALLLTAMLTSYLDKEETEPVKEAEEVTEEKTEEPEQIEAVEEAKEPVEEKTEEAEEQPEQQQEIEEKAEEPVEQDSHFVNL